MTLAMGGRQHLRKVTDYDLIQKGAIMVRSFQEEIEHRNKLRKKYFEDPSYRKWSDVVDNGLTGESYGRWREC